MQISFDIAECTCKFSMCLRYAIYACVVSVRLKMCICMKMKSVRQVWVYVCRNCWMYEFVSSVCVSAHLCVRTIMFVFVCICPACSYLPTWKNACKYLCLFEGYIRHEEFMSACVHAGKQTAILVPCDFNDFFKIKFLWQIFIVFSIIRVDPGWLYLNWCCIDKSILTGKVQA